ncbi:MAG: flagellar export protein FliJ [Bdellovibrionales bacterium]
MAFRFGLEAVLKHRKRLEDEAQREFAIAQNAVDAILRKLEDMYTRMDEVREEIAAAQRHANLNEVRDMETFIGGHKIRIEAVRLEARELLRVAEEKQEALILAAQEKKVLVKLKEKRLVEYKDWLNRIEAKNADDQTQMRQAWGKR